MLCAFRHPVAMCCDLLRHVQYCWLSFKNWSNSASDISGCYMICSCLAMFELVRFSLPNMSQHVATWWPNAWNMLCPTVFRYVVLKCCDRLAEACKCWANNVAVCCVDMLRSFGQGLTVMFIERFSVECRKPKPKLMKARAIKDLRYSWYLKIYYFIKLICNTQWGN